ncbi:d-amino-acid oxidase [Lasallia pustulata]|uniref:D-amino-acid oxidase n=1 Tax=Lasallia pustulata TaxID=136370 RepID=A0A1W5D8I1_9LECA|nr:d-amino-acid oxidase [Lasallia pustulata]
MADTQARVVVVGAGVAGLTTALTLSRNARYKVTVAAEHMPGDYDIRYASPWAGANYLPVSAKGSKDAEWDRNTWPVLEDLAKNHPEAGIHFQHTELYVRNKDATTATAKWFNDLLKPEPWFKDMVPDFKQIPKDQLSPGYDSGTSFTSVCINTALYLPWLASQCLKNGVVFQRKIFKHIAEAAEVHHSGEKADIIVNCTGLSAGTLGGVEDKKMMPARGQIVLVRNEANVMCTNSGTDDGEDEACYIMQRAAGGGTIIGGSFQKGNWESQFDPNLANRIMKRAVDLCPALTGGKGIEHLSVIRHGVGLRPLREGGVRLEKEKIDDVWTVHNYGHGGYGYQSSYGCSLVAEKLVEEALDS